MFYSECFGTGTFFLNLCASSTAATAEFANYPKEDNNDLNENCEKKRDLLIAVSDSIENEMIVVSLLIVHK